MSEDEIKNRLVQVIEEVQTASGRPVAEISDTTCPIGDLGGFDSLNALEVVIQLSTEWDREIAEDIALFKQGRLGRTVAEIAHSLHQILQR